MNEQIASILNKQIQEEMYSAYLYLSMASFFEARNLPGFSIYFKVQAQEEVAHAMGFFEYLIRRGNKVELLEIAKPKSDFGSTIKAVEEALKHEKYITAKIADIYKAACEEKDYPTQNFIQWYIKEQVEEEETAKALVEKINLVGENGANIYLIDKELSTRVFVAPVIG